MESASAMLYYSSPEDAIKRLRSGEDYLRDHLIQQHFRYIQIIVSKMIGKPAESTDEFSVALQAFNEAIDNYDHEKNVKFICFAKLVINRRVIDYIRKSNKYKKEYPFTYFEVDENEDYIEMYGVKSPEIFTEKIEIEEEIIKFQKGLLSYGISIKELSRICPKHKDTKILCISIAKMIIEKEDIARKLEREKRLPILEVLNEFSISRKTVEKHRKYIITLFLILTSEMEIIKGYSDFLMKGVD